MIRQPKTFVRLPDGVVIVKNHATGSIRVEGRLNRMTPGEAKRLALRLLALADDGDAESFGQPAPYPALPVE